MRKRKSSRAAWESLVREWRAGDLTQREFARRKGIAITPFSRWSCRLRRGGKGGVALVPVRVVGESSPPSAAFRVELAGGRALLVPASFDAPALRRPVAALEGVAC